MTDLQYSQTQKDLLESVAQGIAFEQVIEKSQNNIEAEIQHRYSGHKVAMEWIHSERTGCDGLRVTIDDTPFYVSFKLKPYYM